MFDEFKFAIKCGGSTKKVQHANSSTIPLKSNDTAGNKTPPPAQLPALPPIVQSALMQQTATLNKQQQQQQANHNYLKSNSTSNLLINPFVQKQPIIQQQQQQQQHSVGGQHNKRDCKKCQRLRKERMGNESPLQTTIICKHNMNASSMSSLNASQGNNNNNNNSGLLLVEKETSLDTQNSSLKSSAYSHPHLYQQQQQQQLNQFKQQQQQQPQMHQLQFQHNKPNKLNKRPKLPNDLMYEKNSNNSDYILMKQMNQQAFSSSLDHHQPPQPQQQIIPINIDRENYLASNASNSIGNASSQFYSNDKHEQQINYERYLSKSNIMKTTNKPSNRHI